MKERKLENLEPVLKEIKRTLQKIYGKRLKKIILYGSYARGEANENSDLDLLVVLKEMENICEELDRISRPLGEIDLKYDTLTSIIPVKAEDFEQKNFPLFLNARREGIEI